MPSSNASNNIAVDFGDGVVEHLLQPTTRSIFRNVDVLEILPKTVICQLNLIVNRHEPHLEMLNTSHLFKAILPHGIVRAISLKRITHRITLTILIITMICSISNNNHHVRIILVLALPHVGQSTLHSILHVLTSATTTATVRIKRFQSSSQLREITCDSTTVIKGITIVLVLNDLTHNCSTSSSSPFFDTLQLP